MLFSLLSLPLLVVVTLSLVVSSSLSRLRNINRKPFVVVTESLSKVAKSLNFAEVTSLCYSL